MYYSRYIEKGLIRSLNANPVTAILGPRQAGKSTLARHILEQYPNSLFLDLERPSDLARLDDAEWFLQSNSEKLICIDEIQRKPEIFPLLRTLVDNWERNGAFLILGSASRELIQQSSESLAGRIRYNYLTPFLHEEVSETISLNDYMIKGGFPRSLLAQSGQDSYQWREDFITTYLERDLLLWSGFSPATMRRLWSMLAHNNGQTINYSAIAGSLGVSHTTVRNYLELLSETFMVSIVSHWEGNTKKRLVKAPKVYLSDHGILATLLNIRNFNQLSGHPVIGSLWESIVLMNIKGTIPSIEVSFYRTSNGAEVDFIISNGTNSMAIECKATQSPTISKGSYIALSDLGLSKLLIVSPVERGWQKSANTYVVSIKEAVGLINQEMGS